MPQNKEKSITFANFAGLNENYEDFTAKNEFSVFKNFDYNKDGVRGIVPRKGNTIYNPNFLATAKIDTLENIPYSSEFQIAQVGTTLYKQDFTEVGGAGNGSCSSTIQNMAYFLGKVFINPGLLDSGEVKGIIYDVSTGVTSLQSGGPDNGRYLTLYKNRLWVASGNVVYYSQPYMNDNDGDADDWDISNNFIKVSPNSGNEIIALIGTSNALLICMENGDVYPLYGAYPNEFSVPEFPLTTQGPISHRTVRRSRGAVFWLGPDDVYQYVGGAITPVSEKRQIKTQLSKISTDPAIRELAVASIVGDDYVVCFRQTTSATVNKCYVFDIVYRTWREYENLYFFFQASCVTSEGVWITGQAWPDTNSKYKLIQQRNGYADTITTSADTSIIAQAMGHEFFPSDGYMDAQFKKLFGRMSWGAHHVLNLSLFGKSGLRDDPSNQSRAKIFEFLKASADVTDSSLWDENNWANEDATADAGELVWAGDDAVDFLIEDVYKNFNLISNSLRFNFFITYKTNPSVEIQKLKVHYLNKRRIL